MKISVIGAGSWGTALAELLAKNGHKIQLWARKTSVVEGITKKHRNPRYLTDIVLSDDISASTSFKASLCDADVVVVVTPSHVLRSVAHSIKPYVSDKLPIVICSKGVEEESGLLPTELFADILGNKDRLAVLSGPNHAEEVIRGIPAATVIASTHTHTAKYFRDLFATDSFRTYISDDVCGVELCAAFKNIIAISVGISYGLEFGDNTAAMLLTRGLAEMSRLVTACGGKAMTCMGLAGAGDLVATCMSEHSRNRRFGEFLAKGKTLDDFYSETHMVAEGATACKAIKNMSETYGVELPITTIVRSIVWEHASVQEGVRLLSSRPLTTEFYDL